MISNEEWRPIEGFEGAYEVSSLGRVRSLTRTVSIAGGTRSYPGRLLGTTDRQSGYVLVDLRRGEGQDIRRIHVLVAAAFIGPRPPGKVIRHLDSNPGNNAVENLAYGTQSENMKDEVRNGRDARALKTACPRGHLLISVNNTNRKRARGQRECLACKTARDRTKNHPDRDFVEVADQVFRDLVERTAKEQNA